MKWARCSDAKSRRCLQADVGCPPVIPLSGWADNQLGALAGATGSAVIAQLTGSDLLGERAALNHFRVPGQISAGGGCRLYHTQNGWLAMSLTRPDDRELLPALFGDAALDPEDDEAIVARMAAGDARELVTRGAELGLAIAHEHEKLPSPPWEITCYGKARKLTAARPPRVIDLSALWAGPLASHLLQLAGSTVIKVESSFRPDAMRTGDPAFFDLLNRDKSCISLNLKESEGRNALIALVREADIVLDASRPRALLQLGIDADGLVAELPGLVWISITGHGIRETTANRIGFGDDCGVAGGLTAALRAASGATSFVGDAIADPLTGITAARLAWTQWASGQGARTILSMSGVVATAVAEEEARDKLAFESLLKSWATAQGLDFGTARVAPC